MKTIVRLDRYMTKRIQSLPKGVKPLMGGVTLCGSTLPVFITLGLGYLLARDGLRKSFVFIAISIVANLALKQFLHRPRPDTLYVSLMRIKTHSFPSGHAFGSITTYGFIAYLAVVNLNLLLGLVLATLLWLIIILVGVSRVYLGAHYPTDVIGGWVLGALCLNIAIVIA